MTLTALAFSGGKDSMACLHLMREQLDCAIFVDPGFSYPETREMVNYAASLVPVMHVVTTDRKGQNAREGLPADVVPIDWTRVGQEQFWAEQKPVMIQSYLGCCAENRMLPLWAKAKALGVIRLVLGVRSQDGLHHLIKDGLHYEGIERVHPIEGWTDHEVLEYLATKMEVPAHFHAVPQSSSLDCYDCTGFERKSQDRLKWTATRYPAFYAEYLVRRTALDAALREALTGERGGLS